MTPKPPGGSRSAHIDALLERAVAAHQAGRFSEAATIYSAILTDVPSHLDANHLLGVVALQEGKLDRAQELISRALQTDPKHTAAANNLGTVLLRKRELEPARLQFERALHLDRDSVSALSNLGIVLRDLGRPREALVPLRKAFAAEPGSIAIGGVLGACLLETGDPVAAADVFERTAMASPDSADGWSNLAAALTSAGQYARAREIAERALSLQPNSSAALAARAAVEFEQGDTEAALQTYQEAVALPEAASQVHNAYANALWHAGRWSEARTHLELAISMDNNSAISRWKLAVANCRPFYATTAEVNESRISFAAALDDLDQWFADSKPCEAFAAVGTTQPFYIAYHPYRNRELLRRYGEVCCRWMASMPVEVEGGAAPTDRPATHDKIRVGIVSAHIRDHSVWNAITKGWVQHLDKGRFESYLFHLGHIEDGQTAWARSAADRFVDEPKTLSEWIVAIRRAQLDVLIYPEIGMDALTTQLASLRLVDTQAASWGHPETSGLPTLDLYFSGDALEPSEAQDNYTERLVRLPKLGVYVEPLIPPNAASDLSALGLPDSEPLLLCPGTPYKYTPASDPIWAQIAKGLQDSRATRGWGGLIGRFRAAGYGRLVFFRSGNTSADALLERRLRNAFDAERVDFDARVCLLPRLDRPRFYALMQRATVMLDTVQFSGFNNALQAIEAGLPVLAHEGDFMRGRLASGIMRTLGLDELVAVSDEAFVAKAVQLSVNPERLETLRQQMLARRAILFHDLSPIRALEERISSAVSNSTSRRSG